MVCTYTFIYDRGNFYINKYKNKKSIHLEKFIEFPKSFENKDLNEKWISLKKVRDICNISIEAKRASKEIGSSLEANLSISLNKKLFEIVKNIDFAELCITSNAQIKKSDLEEIKAVTTKAEGIKCPVCWKINKDKCERHYIINLILNDQDEL